MIRIVHTVSLLAALLFLLIALFYVDTQRELALAYHASKQGDIDQALRHARRCIAFSSDERITGKALILAAKECVKADKEEIALKYAQKLLQKSPDNQRALLLNGEINLSLGNYDEALKNFSKGFNGPLQLSDYQRAYYHSLFGLAALKSGKKNLAEREAKAALSLSKRVAETYDLFSKIYEARSNFKTALSYCQKAYNISLRRDKLFFMTKKGRALSDRLVRLKAKVLQLKQKN